MDPQIIYTPTECFNVGFIRIITQTSYDYPDWVLTSPTKKSAAANEVRNRLDIVLRDLFLEINHRTIPFPTIVTKPATPNHVAKAIFASNGSGLPWFPEVRVSFISTASTSLSTSCFSSDQKRFLITNFTKSRVLFEIHS